MYDAGDLVGALGKAALAAVENGKPSGMFFGTVQSVLPLKVLVEQRLLLGPAQLLCGSLVMDFTLEMTMAHETEDRSPLTAHAHPEVASASFDATHRHAYTGRKAFLVHLGLRVGEKVVLLREQGGQRYMILDRVRG